MKVMIFENRSFKLTLSEEARALSLICKDTGEELIPAGADVPFFSATQERPYNNEIKLAYTNKRTTLEASGLRLDGSELIVKFGLFPFEARIGIEVKDEYMAFTLEGFIADKKDYPQPMDFPPVTELSLIRLPVDKGLTYGDWMNVCDTEVSSVAVMATSPHTFIDSEINGDKRILTASARRGIKLIGCAAALIACDKTKLLDAVEALEEDYDLPRGVSSRKNGLLNASIYWTARLSPENVDEHIAYAKRGGFKLMLLYHTCMCKFEGKTGGNYELCGNYDYNEHYPNGEDDLRAVLEKIKAAGIKPGLHFLHTHVGVESRYVTPHADRRLNLKRRFTLSRPLSKTDTTVYVDENPIDSPISAPPCRILRFDGEIISYESYTTEPPYMFTGCVRGHFETEITEHSAYTSGGVLDLSEFSGSSIYLNQESDLQDEIGDKIAAIYNCGFEFVYFDGSEGTNAPFEYHVPNAQYRLYRKFKNPPIFCEGAAKAHFGWHMLSGGNAFDVFPNDIFKEMIVEHPLKESKFMRNERTRVNFGWWRYRPDTRVDLFEFGTGRAAGCDCPVSIMIPFIEDWKKNPRTDDILDMMARWEDVRTGKLLTERDKLLLQNENAEYTMLKNAAGEYELTEYSSVAVGDGTTGVRAFIFERKGCSYAVIWDDCGESVLTLDTDRIISYTHEVETEDIPYTVSNKTALFPTSGRAYICTSLGLPELKALLASARVKRI